MSHVAVTGFTQAVLVLVALRKGLQEVHEIANATGDKVQKVGVWLEAFHWAGIVNVKLSTKGEGSSFLWELNTNQEAVSQRKESPPRINPHKVTIAEFLRVVLTSSKIIAEDIDVSLGISLSTIRSYFRVLVEQKIVRVYQVPSTGKHSLGRRAYISQLFVPAGISSAQFTFYGFIPHKKGRETIFKEIQNSDRTSVFYESVHRIEKTLESLATILDDRRQVAFARELTKIHEEAVRGTAQEVQNYFKTHTDHLRGEFVVIIEGEK